MDNRELSLPCRLFIGGDGKESRFVVNGDREVFWGVQFGVKKVGRARLGRWRKVEGVAVESVSITEGNVGSGPACLIPSYGVKRRYTEARLVAFRNGFAHIEPPYVSHDGRLVNLKTFPASVDSPFMHHEAPHVRGGGAFLCHE